MFTNGALSTHAKFQKRKQVQYSTAEKARHTGPILNNVVTNTQKLIDNYKNNLADIYLQKYGHLCSHLPNAIHRINLYLDKRNPASGLKKSAHVNKRGDGSYKNNNLPAEVLPKVENVYKVIPQKTSIQMWDSSYYIPPNFGTVDCKKIAPQNSSNPQNANNSNSPKEKIKEVKNQTAKNVKNSNAVKEKAVKEMKTHIEQMIKNKENIGKNNAPPQIIKNQENTRKNNASQQQKDNSKSESNSDNPKQMVKTYENSNNQKPQAQKDNSKTESGDNPKPLNKIIENSKNNSSNTPNNQKPQEQKTQTNKNVRNVSPKKENNDSSLPKNTKGQITEIYKRPETEKSATSLQNPFPMPKIESPSFQKITENLTKIIKNLQKQIHEVSVSKPTMEEIPSALIQPKQKEFFKKSTPLTINNQTPKSAELKAKPAVNNNVTNSSQKNNASSCTLAKSSITITPKASSSSSKRWSRLSLTADPLKLLKDEVHRAVRDHKTFTVYGRYPTIRKAMRERGWVEKFHVTHKNHLNEELRKYPNYTIAELLLLLKHENLAELCKDLIKSKLLGGYQVDFYWSFRTEGFKENSDAIKLTTINKLKRDIFSYTNKQGLCDSNKYSYWYHKPNISKLNHPRTYSLTSKNGDLEEFVDDFNITAAMSLLKWIVKTSITKESKLISPSGKVPLEVFDFALNECCKFIKRANHEDIDTIIPQASNHEWDQFLDYFYKIVHYSNHFTEGKERIDENTIVGKSNYVLNTLTETYPYLEMDGMLNIWIMKPIASCRGRGIHLCRTLPYALKVIKQNPNTKYIIQKYIERPLLIYNTKFDIRQWFLISSCSPLTIWIYKECYLRFSSQTYNLRKLHESIHLTNNSVQSKYKNTSLDAVLPSYNMWDSSEFKRYLANLGYPNKFNDIIYPGMKQCIIAAILMHQDKMIVRKNCFELYGADFILTEDFKPWMLEINSDPALYPSTPVTARMSPKVQEDVIKVVVDHAHNVRASTGQFEMIYREQLTKLPEVKSLEVRGHPLSKDYFYCSPEEQSMQCAKPSYKAILVEQKQKSLKVFGEEIKKTLKNLLDIIHAEKTKRIIARK